jgi:hypothetical protein
MKKGLFLDDERLVSDVSWIIYPEESISWTIVRCYESFKEEVEHQSYDYYSFDHDIQDFDDPLKERTGYDCVKYLVEHLLEQLLYLGYSSEHVQCFFHTQNIIGKENMEKYWENFQELQRGILRD